MHVLSRPLPAKRRPTAIPWRAAASVLAAFVLADTLCRWLALPVPGSLVAMLGLFGVFVARGGVPADVDRLARLALPWLPLYFVPVLALALREVGQLGDALWAVVVVVTLGTLLTACVTAFVGRRSGSDIADAPAGER